jgi:hypothetical protein
VGAARLGVLGVGTTVFVAAATSTVVSRGIRTCGSPPCQAISATRSTAPHAPATTSIRRSNRGSLKRGSGGGGGGGGLLASMRAVSSAA